MNENILTITALALRINDEGVFACELKVKGRRGTIEVEVKRNDVFEGPMFIHSFFKNNEEQVNYTIDKLGIYLMKVAA